MEVQKEMIKHKSLPFPYTPPTHLLTWVHLIQNVAQYGDVGIGAEGKLQVCFKCGCQEHLKKDKKDQQKAEFQGHDPIVGREITGFINMILNMMESKPIQ